MEFPITLYTKRPNYEKLEVEVQGMQIIEAYDGTTAWSVNPFQGMTSATKADEAMNKEAAKKSFEDELLDYAAKGHTVEKLEDHEIEGAQVFQLKLTKKSGDEQIYFFDQENYVPVMIKSFANAGPMKGQPVETYLSDYKEVENLIIPHSITQKINGQVLMQATMNSIDLNPEITDDIFKFPAPADIPAEKKMTEEVPVKKMQAKPEKSMLEDQPKTLEKRKSENPVKN
jgi:outer membrane lipoprotein-sorting protein